MRPPFVPRVRGEADVARYFDEEGEIMSCSDRLDESSVVSVGTTPPVTEPQTAGPWPGLGYGGLFPWGRQGRGEACGMVGGTGGAGKGKGRVGEVGLGEGQGNTNPGFSGVGAAAGAKGKKSGRGGRAKEKKRARDKLLRDPKVGRTVLEIRKRGAFIGYTYRRPRGTVMMDLWEERVGRAVMRQGQGGVVIGV